MTAKKEEYIDAYLAAGGSNPEGKTKEQLIKETSNLMKIAVMEGEEAKGEFLFSIEEGETEVTEVTVSYSRKKNLGNYESRDFFTSMKAQTKGNVSAVAKHLAWLCQQEVYYQTKKTIND